MRRSLSIVFLLLAGFCTLAATDLPQESPYLQNIRQLTFPSMGFEKAGEAYFSPDSQTILFQAVPQGQSDYQIYTMSLEFKEPKMVSLGIGACTCAYFHPNGEKIIFASSHSDPNPQTEKDPHLGKYVWDLTPYMNIYEANPDGSDLRALTEGSSYHAECAYSPDGSQIVFASNLDGSMNLYRMDSDGSNLFQITHTQGCYNGGPFFSPNGENIIYRADPDHPHYLQIYLTDLEGKEVIQITDNAAVNWAPYWHPNGKVIAFTTSLQGHHAYEIYLLNVDTKKSFRLTHHLGFDGLPVFNREGTQLLWTSKRGEDGTCQVFLADFILPEELN